jgi:hypothetical protein
MFAVYNASHKMGSIRSNQAMIRILGYGNYDETMRLAQQYRGIETRVWPVSGPTNVAWRPLLNKNVSDQTMEELQADYARTDELVLKWNQWREKMSEEVYHAAQQRIMRSLDQVKAEGLLASRREAEQRADLLKPAREFDAAVGLMMLKDNKPYVNVENVPRTSEQRGQTWSLIAILGDANTGIRREHLLEELSKAYEACEDKDRFDFDAYSRVMDDLVEEPIIAFLAFGDQPDVLVEHAEQLSKVPEFKHADLAVVMNYSWIQPSYSGLTKRKKYSEPVAQEFFNKMASASNTVPT